MTRTRMMLAGSLLAFSLPALAGAPKLADIAAAHYRDQLGFPAWSQPVLDGVDPLLAERTPSVVRMQGPDGAAPALESWFGAQQYQRGEAALIQARLVDAAADDWALSATWDSSLGTLARTPLRDDGQGADALAGDGIYSAAVTLPEAHQPPAGQADNVMVRIHAENAKGEVRKNVNGFLYSHPGAALTGQVKPQVVEGHLALLAEVDVAERGRYHLRGTLADAGGLPVASAQAAQVLEPGRQWLPLRYHGRIFHSLGLAGTLQLASLTLTTTQGMPNALGPVLTAVAQFPAPALTELTAQPHQDAALLETIRRLEAPLAATAQVPAKQAVQAAGDTLRATLR